MAARRDTQLEQLFRECDKSGTGQIGRSEFRALCNGFDIEATDSDAIFDDLDHDGDGYVSVDDFAWGFRDFLAAEGGTGAGGAEGAVGAPPARAAERRRSLGARRAWSQLVTGVGLPSVSVFLRSSGPKLAELYEELQTLETYPQLAKHFEHAFSSLLEDVKKLHEENKKMEETITKEKEAHRGRLQALEEELEAQVARVEAQARDETRRACEADKRALRRRMEAEIAELHTHLAVFQKVNEALSRTTGDGVSEEKHEAAMENRELKQMLADTRTNLALLRSEMAHLKSEYDLKCRLLNEQEETVSEYQQQNDMVHRQLELLHEANSRMQDTNDSLMSVLEVPDSRSPRPLSPCCCSQTSSTGSGQRSSISPSIRLWQTEIETASDFSNVFDSSPNSLEQFSSTPQGDVQFGLKKLMEDLDSGRSTMREQHDADSDRSLHDELVLAGSKIPDSSIEVHLCKHPVTSQQISPLNIPKISITASELEPTGPPDRTFKIVLAGDAAVGKSCFIFRFCKGVFHKHLGSTLGVDFQVKTIRVAKRNVTLQLWDTAGQERFRSMTKTYFRRADGVILLYDVTNEKSFLNVRQWIQGIAEVTEREVPITLCGNKVDLRSESRARGISCIETAQGSKLAEENKAIFMETSSKTGDNILEAVLALSQEMLQLEDTEVKTSAMEIKNEPSKSCCANKK